MSKTPKETLTVLATIIRREEHADEIALRTGLPHDQVASALSLLHEHGLVRDRGGGNWDAQQRVCEHCSEHPADGARVHIDRATLVWICDTCWRREGGEHGRWFVA